MLGFDSVTEVAIGADFCTIDEAEDFVKKVPAEQPFMATSCCPAWSVMAKKCFPEFAPYISMALTPMVLTARMIKKIHKGCKVVFIGPCSAKKLEASRRTIRSDVDFVLTFEELMGMFAAKDIDLRLLKLILRFCVPIRWGLQLLLAVGLQSAMALQGRLRISSAKLTLNVRSRSCLRRDCVTARRC